MLFTNIPKEFSGSFLFFDNNALIALMNNDKLLQKFLMLRKSQNEFLTITPVAIEFARTDNLENYNKRVSFLQNMFTIVPVEKQLDANDPFFFILNKLAKCSYVDNLLYYTINKYPTSYVVSENHHDFITSVLDRKFIITLDQGNRQIRNLAFYQINQSKIDKASVEILKSVKR